MPMDEQEIVSLIKKKLPNAEVSIRDLAGDGDHYAATRRGGRVSRQDPRSTASAGL